MAWGWVIHVVGDYFPDDGQRVGDPEWMEHGLSRGWSLLTQDERIATQPVAITLLRRYKGIIHCLDSAQLPVRTKG